MRCLSVAWDILSAGPAFKVVSPNFKTHISMHSSSKTFSGNRFVRIFLYPLSLGGSYFCIHCLGEVALGMQADTLAHSSGNEFFVSRAVHICERFGC